MPVMNIEGLRKKLLAAARAHQPDDRVPYAFEKRILARIAHPPVLVDFWTAWAGALWRGAITCVLAMTMLGSVMFFHSRHNARAGSEEFSADFEQTMLAAVDPSYPEVP